jgi:uncharacterized protein
MLIGFRLRNYRSFLHEQNFGYCTSADRAHESTHCVPTGMKSVPRLSKSAIVFGPNGSGKTNFLRALQTLRDMVLHSTAYSESQFAQRYTPFLLGPSAHRATDFEIDLLVRGVRYRYSVSYDAHRVWSERLLVYRTGKSQRWFSRRFDAATSSESWAPFSPNFNGPREMWRKATHERSLFLTTAALLNSEQLKPLFHWFEHCLEIIFPSDQPHAVRAAARSAARMQNPEFKTQMLQLLRSVDIKVDDVRIAEDGRASPAEPPRVEFSHARSGWPPVWLAPEYEAAGTHRLFALFGLLLSAAEQGKLLVIDEFDASLHPLVARSLIRFVNDPAVSERGAQLLLVSHNTTLMDLDMLRRDEIWLTELDDGLASTLSTVLRSSPRKHEQIAKCYLRGRYGAIPEIHPHLLSRPGERDHAKLAS